MPAHRTVTERVWRSADRLARRAWSEGPGPFLRAAGWLYGVATETRNILYDRGFLRVHRVAVPVISVGGLTVGGSAKTPLAAELGLWMIRDGLRVGIVTPGARDEAVVHEMVNPSAVVVAERDRLSAASRLAANGCEVVVLDSGFQHRRLARDLDIVALDTESLERPPRVRLPASPYREGLGALRRADAVILTRRDPAERAAGTLTVRLRSEHSELTVAVCRLVPGPMVPANRAAGEADAADAAIAVAGIMKPAAFFRQIRDRLPHLEEAHALPDHYRYPPSIVDRWIEEAGKRGMVGTLKDIVKLREVVGERTPLWYVADGLEWLGGEAALRRRLREAVGIAGADAAHPGHRHAARTARFLRLVRPSPGKFEARRIERRALLDAPRRGLDAE
ncbi:MAG: tetraacyldisaccharide 4'-kinase [Gemmatimonadota bacterium]